MSDKREDLIVDLLQEVRLDQKEHSNILTKLQQDVSKNVVDLAAYKKEVDDKIEKTEESVKKLEVPYTFIANIKKTLLATGGLAGAAYAILRVYNL